MGREYHSPLVRPAVPSIVGPMSREVVRRVVLRNLGPLIRCQEQGLRENPTLEGGFMIRLTIGRDGAVASSSVANRTAPSVSTGDCMARAARNWQFPAPPGGATVVIEQPIYVQHPE